MIAAGRGVLSLAAVLLLGCWSAPRAPVPEVSSGLPGDLSGKTVHLPKCARDLPEAAFLSCRVRLDHLYIALVETGLFREIEIGEEVREPGDLVVDLHDFPRVPYSFTPGHNPGFLLLSLALPFWWTEPLGFRFSIRELPAGAPLLVDTRWEGTMVMWSLASLLNFAPGRTFEGTDRQDVELLRRALTGE